MALLPAINEARQEQEERHRKHEEDRVHDISGVAERHDLVWLHRAARDRADAGGPRREPEGVDPLLRAAAEKKQERHGQCHGQPDERRPADG